MFAINESKQSESKIERCIAQRTLHSHKGETNGILKFKTGDHIHAYGIYDRKNKKILPFNRDRHHHIIEDGESAGEFWYGALVDKKVDLQQEEEETGSSKNNNKQEIEELQRKNAIKIQALFRGYHIRSYKVHRKIENLYTLFIIRTSIQDQLKRYDMNHDLILDTKELKIMLNNSSSNNNNNIDINTTESINDNVITNFIKYIHKTLGKNKNNNNNNNNNTRRKNNKKNDEYPSSNTITIDQFTAFIYDEYTLQRRTRTTMAKRNDINNNNNNITNQTLVNNILTLIETELIKMNGKDGYLIFYVINYFIYKNNSKDGHDMLIDYSYVDYKTFESIILYFMYTPLTYQTTATKQCKECIYGDNAIDILKHDIQELFHSITTMMMKNNNTRNNIKNKAKKTTTIVVPPTINTRQLWQLLINGCKNTIINKRQIQINTFLMFKYKQSNNTITNSQTTKRTTDDKNVTSMINDGLLSIVYNEINRKRSSFIHSLYYIWNAFDINKNGFIDANIFKTMIMKSYDIINQDILYNCRSNSKKNNNNNIKMPKIMKDIFLNDNKNIIFFQDCIVEMKKKKNKQEQALRQDNKEDNITLYRNEFIDFICNGLTLNYSPPLLLAKQKLKRTTGENNTLDDYKDHPLYILYIYRDTMLKYCLWGSIKPNNATIELHKLKRKQFKARKINDNIEKRKKEMMKLNMNRQHDDNDEMIKKKASKPKPPSISNGDATNKDYRNEREARRQRTINMHELQIKQSSSKSTKSTNKDYRKEREVRRQRTMNMHELQIKQSSSKSTKSTNKDYRKEREVRRQRTINMHELQIKNGDGGIDEGKVMMEAEEEEEEESDGDDNTLKWTEQLSDNTQLC